MTGRFSHSWPCQMVLIRTNPIRPYPLFCLLMKNQHHRGLFLLHPPPAGCLEQSRNLGLWHIMYETNGLERAPRSTSGCYKKYGAESGRGGRRQSAIFWSAKGKTINGHWGMVCAKVRRFCHASGKGLITVRDFTDIDILKVGE